ncbi:MAG TPA: NAD(P)-binding protein, partial [Thermomicrobiales bacterium]|nr:NAD(P)-binding protein [Thermomicrobiales bacterium]
MSAPRTEVLIVGAGMAGAAIAKRLSDARVRVTVLDQGSWVMPGEHPHYSHEFEFAIRRRWGR